MYYVTKKLTIVNQEPREYQFKGTKAECKAYQKNANAKYSTEEKTANEMAFVASKNGAQSIKNYFGSAWLNSLKAKDKATNERRRRK